MKIDCGVKLLFHTLYRNARCTIQLPNKLYSYNYSVLSKFPILLKSLQKGDVQVLSLFMSNQDKFESINDFIETLDALYALRKIDYDDEKGVIHFVI